jgi:hypothetical protein
LLARNTAEGALEIRRFEVGERLTAHAVPALDTSEQSRPLPAVLRLPVPAEQPPSDAQLVAGQPATVAYAVAVDAVAAVPAEGSTAAADDAPSAPSAGPGMQALLWPYDTVTEPILLGGARGGTPWIEACEAHGVRWFAYGTDAELALSRIEPGDEPTRPLPAAALDLGVLLPRDEQRRDRVRVLCAAERATVVVLARDRTLRALRCDRTACAHGPVLAGGVTAFDAVVTGDTTVVAYTRSDQPQVTVVRLDAKAAPLEPAHTPAPCWDPQGGMCGQPTLVTAPSRLLLCARDGSDLVALESQDGGRHWKPLGGLQVDSAISSDVNAPMQQHRIRKGLD